MESDFYLRFWGVRGTMPTPDARMLAYGGNTSCVEVRCSDVIFALDAGTGIIQMAQQKDVSHLHLLLSHTHIDHIIGLCGMPKIFDEAFSADVWAGHLLPDMFVSEALSRLMSPPLFPVPLHAVSSHIAFHDFTAGQALRHADFRRNDICITTLPLNHPDRATGYRIEYNGHAMCYITDVEHRDDTLDENLLEFISGSNVFIYDSTYDESMMDAHRGWGHSSWQHGMRLAQEAGVGTMAMFHHDPCATDAVLDARLREASDRFDIPVIVAKEGMQINI